MGGRGGVPVPILKDASISILLPLPGQFLLIPQKELIKKKNAFHKITRDERHLQ